MMILMSISISPVVIGVLCVSLAILVLFIAYRKLLAYWGKGEPVKEDYCTLYSLEVQPASGEVEIYFTTESPRKVIIELLNKDMSANQVIADGEYSQGGHIIRFNTVQLSNGDYYYCLRTDNQKTMKKMTVSNG